MLKAKKEDPYTLVHEELSDIGDALEVLRTVLKQLDSDRTVHNRTAADTKPIKATLTTMNNEIAYYDVIELARKYDQRLAEKQNADEA